MKMGSRRNLSAAALVGRIQKSKQCINSEREEGSIVRIKLDNFLTYDSVEFHAGPSLNVIIGPNGTGKSSIVCAICLGLGGKTGLLGRAQQYGDYIKYGCQKAKIELELYNSNGENWIILREIQKNNTSSWSVNGRTATMKSVDELVARLNIQVGNLCQFLPQEKVADFAKMTPEDLLENTEKAVGIPEMYENHQRLKQSRIEARSHTQNFNSLKERLADLQQMNARLEQDVKNFEEREKHLEKIRIMKMKRPWLEYEMHRQEHDKLKMHRDKKVEELKAAKSKLHPLDRKIDALRKKKEEMDAQMKSKTDVLRKYANDAHGNSKEIEKYTDQFQEVQDLLKQKESEEESRKRRIVDLKRQVEALEEELQTSVETANIQVQLEEVTNEMRRTNQRMTVLNQDGDRVRREIEGLKRQVDGFQQELKEIQNIENRKLEMLRNRHKPTYDAVMWYKDNRDKFQGQVHLPLLLSVNPTSPAVAKFIEMHISANDMRAFIFENTEDYNVFMREVRDKQNLRVNALKVPPQQLAAFNARHNISRYSQFGFVNYLTDYIVCADGVRRYLCAQYHIHNIPVGSRRTKDLVEDIKRKCPELRTFYTDEYQYTCRVSKYDKSVSSRSTKIRDPQWMSASVDASRIQELNNEIKSCQEQRREKEATYTRLQQESQELDTKMNKLREQKKNLSQLKDKKKRLQSQIDSKKQRILNEEAEAIDLDAEKEATDRKKKDLNIKMCVCLQKMKDNTKECLSLSIRKVRLSLKHASIVRDLQNLEDAKREQSHSLQDLEREFEEAKERVREIKDKAKRLLSIAKKATGTADNEELSPEIRALFKNVIGNTVEEIDEAIHIQEARADSLYQTDEKVVQEYRNRKTEINQLETEIENREREISGHQERIEEIKRQWLEPLRELMEKINENFGYFFSCMNCAGEVDLSVPANEEDYEKYGVRIKVKYRDAEQLRELNMHHQSGGERSVATVLYLLALQELAKCPFRCVDEINQGMDPVNERKVFELVVKTVCQRSRSQYFLLSPKLLPDMEYADNMTYLCVYNGPHMLSHKDWDLKKFIQRRRKLGNDD
ncbi:structural maintenance of chromosomes protein 5-like [Saccostrea echinata]|uniref:structural maintenance of chromosomes protein 5-like n=1 Tax=Saccostrea echinata TaxID=191078 RepID=UPI002A81C1AF|nr:structural maintenance of chromosomes protein 5-like [Saccostrea echinata]